MYLTRYTEQEKRRILGKVVEVAVKTTFHTHFYQWGGKIYRQKKGGAIGLRATGTVAKVAMEVWIRTFKAILIAAGVKVYLLSKYVDDVLMILGSLRKGTRWEGGAIRHSLEMKKQDEDQGRSRSEVTFKVLKDAANSIMPFLKFTGEWLEGERGIAVLDTWIWFGPKSCDGEWFSDNKKETKIPGREPERGMAVLYRFYSKPMASKLGILKRSAVSEGTKVSTACSEILRRLKTTSTLISKKIFEEVTSKYMDNLIGMGNPEEWRVKVLIDTLRGYRRILAPKPKENLGGTEKDQQQGCHGDGKD